MVQGVSADEIKTKSVFVFYEFIYFYMHLTLRISLAQLTESQIQKLQGYLGPVISETAVNTFFQHWPDIWLEKVEGARIEQFKGGKGPTAVDGKPIELTVSENVQLVSTAIK